MCLFPLPAKTRLEPYGSHLIDNSITEYDCGSCPECLRKRSNSWALRAYYESKSHVHNCMITLTYDNFVRDPKTGRIVGETVPDPDLKVNQRDVQLFIKRLRKYFSGNSKSDIRYIACAEYGSRTHRAHYHLILFGVHFDDFHFYKKSKRGNIIYMSNILTNLWNHGICTIDCINVNTAVARYCTKYVAKSRSDKTFMLASQRLGLSKLLEEFNGISYFIDGREYPIPRRVWQEIIFERYCMDNATFKYVNRRYSDDDFDGCLNEDEYLLNRSQREMFRQIRNDDFQYQKYLAYWSDKGKLYSSVRPSVLQRIYSLDDRKYHNYKIAALDCYNKRKLLNSSYPAPGSGCVSSYFRSLQLSSRLRGRVFDPRFRLIKSSDVFPFIDHLCNSYSCSGHRYKPRSSFVKSLLDKVTCPSPSRPNRASDTKSIKLVRIFDDDPFFEKNIQLSLDI